MPTGPVVDLANFSNAMQVRGLFNTMAKQYLATGYLNDKMRRAAGKVRLGGRVMEVPLETRGMASFGGQFEHEAISDPDAPGFEFGTVAISTLTSSFQISLQAHLSSQNDRDAWVGAKIRSLQNTVEMFGMNFSRTLWGWGTGALSRVNTINADTPVAGTHELVLEPNQGASAGDTYGARFHIPGQRLVGSSTLTGTSVDKDCDLQVTRVDLGADTIYVQGSLGAAAALAAADYLIVGSLANHSMNRMPVGVYGAIDDGTRMPVYLGINRTGANARDYWKAQVSRNVGTLDLENHIQTQCDTVETSVGGMTDIILMSLGVWRRFANDLRGDREYVTAADTGRYKAGTRMILYCGANENDIAIGRDRDVPAQTMTGFDWRCWYIGELLGAGWLQQFGERSIFRQIPSTLDWYATYAWMGQPICNKPAANWISHGVAEA